MNIKEYLSAAVNDKVTCTPLTYHTTQEQEGSLPWEATTVLPPAPSQHRGSCPGPVTLGGCWVGGLPVRATPPRLSPPPEVHCFSAFSKRSRSSDNAEVRGATLHAVENRPVASDSPQNFTTVGPQQRGRDRLQRPPPCRPRAPVPYATRRHGDNDARGRLRTGRSLATGGPTA